MTVMEIQYQAQDVSNSIHKHVKEGGREGERKMILYKLHYCNF